MNVIRIHPDVSPVPPIVLADEKLRSAYWRGARNYWTAAKQARRSGQPSLASLILASARQALAIATAADAWERVREIAREEFEAAETHETYFVENLDAKPIAGTPVPLRCPFCGDPDMVSIATRAGPEDEYGASYYAECSGCGAEGPSGSTQVDAAQRWNQRPDSRQEAGR